MVTYSCDKRLQLYVIRIFRHNYQEYTYSCVLWIYNSVREEPVNIGRFLCVCAAEPRFGACALAK